ncbi:hypothetical protein BDF21DRAFT_384830 [Thamnidium elegans]|uniref:Uncharacterized protein n=1 Tax=Thamnidium elegans TaxID=101142 RepID=A0A8H7SZN2_9FUNG|nr:hypothetical protein INT48_006660 [Thamnidium elegans]KAI8077027.1 hypothetical protein BDF21DRAFT_384830 [Thamnidium elegans]
MPHKRAKASIRKARKAEVDLPVTGDDAMSSADTPKGFSRLFRFKEMAIKRQQEKVDIKNGVKTEDSTKNIGIQPGEKMKDFVQRVESEYKSDMLSAQKASKPVSDRKKRNQETRKQKKTAKILKEAEFFGGRDFDDLKDNVKFGEVADAPPVLNKIPKVRGREKQIMEAAKLKQAAATAKGKTTTETPAAGKKDTGYESEEDENMKLLKASHKRSLKQMSAAARRQLDNERDMVIEAYRAKKAKRMEGSGFAK